MRNSPPAPIHVVPIDGPPTDRDHRASSLCPCGPEPTHRDLSTMATVWVHRPWRAQEQEVAFYIHTYPERRAEWPSERLRGERQAVATAHIE